MRIYIWHGYLLSGTGSNEYTRALARALSLQGHDVTVFSQDPNAEQHDLGGAKTVRPELTGRLPVFVLDRYPDLEAGFLPDFTEGELQGFVNANVAAITAEGPADLLICNHILMGGPVGAASGLPYVVKAHGSELEFVMRGRPELCEVATEATSSALAIITGSVHVERVVHELMAPRTKVAVIPPGVDIDQMRPRDRQEAVAQLIDEAEQDPPNDGNERLPDPGNVDKFREMDPDKPLIVYVGKLSKEKGVDILLTAAQDLPVQLVIVGFGPQRELLEELAESLELSATFTGPLQHRHLANLWPLAAASIVPSVFPEAFGMVAAEAAACGCPPIVAYHSGLAEVVDGLRRYLPDELRPIVSFENRNIQALHDRLLTLISLSGTQWQQLSAGGRSAAVDLWSWNSVAARIAALAHR